MGEALHDEGFLERTAVRLINDFTRSAAPDYARLVLANLVDIGVFNGLILGHQATQIGEDNLTTRIAARLQYGTPLHKSRARKCRAAVIKRGSYALARDKINLARYAHIKRVRKYGARLIRVLALAQMRLKLCHKFLGTLWNVAGWNSLKLNRLHQPLHLRNNRRLGFAATDSKELNLVVSVELREARIRAEVTLINTDEFLEFPYKFLRLGLRPRGKKFKLAKGQEMDASRRVIVIKLRRNTLTRSRKCGTNFICRPGERLHTPFLTLSVVIFNNILCAVGEDDIHHRESRSREKPFVRSK